MPTSHTKAILVEGKVVGAIPGDEITSVYHQNVKDRYGFGAWRGSRHCVNAKVVSCDPNNLPSYNGTIQTIEKSFN